MENEVSAKCESAENLECFPDIRKKVSLVALALNIPVPQVSRAILDQVQKLNVPAEDLLNTHYRTALGMLTGDQRDVAEQLGLLPEEEREG